MNVNNLSLLGGLLVLATSFPAPAAPKVQGGPLNDLRVTKLDSEAVLLSYTSDTVVGPIKPVDRFKFRLAWVENGRRISLSSDWLFSPANIFGNGPCKDRFRLAKVVKANQANPQNGVAGQIHLATIEDLGPKGGLLELKKGSRNGLVLRDYTVTLQFKGKESVLKEKDQFRLPFGAKKGTRYQFDSVNKKGEVVITWTDGQERDSLSLPVPQKQ